jgi:hypothetical protein
MLCYGRRVVERWIVLNKRLNARVQKQVIKAAKLLLLQLKWLTC